VEHQIVSALFDQLDELGAGSVGTDHDHGLSIGRGDLFRSLLHVHGASGVAGLDHRFEPVFLERQLGPGKPVETEGIVLVEHGDLGNAEVPDQVSHRGAGFLVIRSPDVDDIALERLTQGPGTGEQPDQRDSGLLHQRNDLHRRGGPHVAGKSEHSVFIDQLLSVGHATRRIVSVVVNHQLDATAVDATAIVDMIEVAQGPVDGLCAQKGGMPGKSAGRTDNDFIIPHSNALGCFPVPGRPSAASIEAGEKRQ
jgi:hypothetical protein